MAKKKRETTKRRPPPSRAAAAVEARRAPPPPSRHTGVGFPVFELRGGPFDGLDTTHSDLTVQFFPERLEITGFGELRGFANYNLVADGDVRVGVFEEQ